MLFNNLLLKTCVLIIFCAIAVGCTKSANPPSPVDPVKPQPGQAEVVVTSLSVDHGAYNQTVVIKGSGFNKEISANKVSFNNKEAVITAATATDLTVSVPLSAGTGNVVVTNGAKSVIGPSFTYNYTFIKVVLAGNQIRGFQNGKGTAASFSNIQGLAVNSTGDVFVADQYNNLIRKISSDGEVSTFAGDGNRGVKDGKGITASFNYPSAITIDKDGNLFVIDAGSIIRKITPTGDVSTIAGSEKEGYTNGNGHNAEFNDIKSIAADLNGNLFVVDQFNRIIRKITATGDVSTYMETGTGNSYPTLIDIDNTNRLYVCKIPESPVYSGNIIYQFNNLTLERISAPGVAFEGYMSGVAIDKENNMYILSSTDQILKIKSSGEQSILTDAIHNNKAVNSLIPHASIAYSPSVIAVDNSGICYITDGGGLRLLKVGLQ